MGVFFILGQRILWDSFPKNKSSFAFRRLIQPGAVLSLAILAWRAYFRPGIEFSVYFW
jgi:hypothetical protein